MKLKTLAAAAALALGASASFADTGIAAPGSFTGAGLALETFEFTLTSSTWLTEIAVTAAVTPAAGSTTGYWITSVTSSDIPVTFTDLGGTLGNTRFFNFVASPVPTLLAAGSYHFTVTGTALKPGATFTGNVTTIPEPETYALMLAGLGAVGFIARRRRTA